MSPAPETATPAGGKGSVDLFGHKVSWDAIVVAAASLIAVVLLYRAGKPASSTPMALTPAGGSTFSGSTVGDGSSLASGPSPGTTIPGPIGPPGNPGVAGPIGPAGAPGAPGAAGGTIAWKYGAGAPDPNALFWRWSPDFAAAHGLSSAPQVGNWLTPSSVPASLKGVDLMNSWQSGSLSLAGAPVPLAGAGATG